MSIIEVDPSWQRPGGWGLDLLGGDAGRYISPDVFQPVEYSILALGPDSHAADHSHPDPEALLCFSGSAEDQDGLRIAWLDGAGRLHEELMNPQGRPRLFVIGPDVPHVVTNRSKANVIGIELRSVPRADRQVTRQNVFAALISKAT